MRRENHRRRGVYRASAGGFGHRAVYVGAAVATAALLAGFGAAILVYGPLGQPYRQIAGSTLPVAPNGVHFGTAGVIMANALAGNGTGYGLNLTWNYSAAGGIQGPCNVSGVWDNGTQFNATNASQPWNMTLDNTTLVCLNSIQNSILNATWYYQNGVQSTFNTYSSGGVVNGSYYAAGGVNISSCSNWTLFHNINTGAFNGSYIPCQTYFEMNNNTTTLPAFNATNASAESLWSPNQSGYAPNDILYVVPVFFQNASNATYEITIAIAGITPVAQTFYFNDTAGVGGNTTVVFAFDMTAAWLMDLTVTNETPFNSTSLAIYASVGVSSAIVTECGLANGMAVCPVISRT
jgi:hypothetical protein